MGLNIHSGETFNQKVEYNVRTEYETRTNKKFKTPQTLVASSLLLLHDD